MKSDYYRDITEFFSLQEFEDLLSFVLENGNNKTYCSLYNNNPHYAFAGFDVYLNPVSGNNSDLGDFKLSDFNELLIHDLNEDIQYYHICSGFSTKVLPDGSIPDLKENRVYLLNIYDENMNRMEKNLRVYIKNLKMKQ